MQSVTKYDLPGSFRDRASPKVLNKASLDNCVVICQTMTNNR
jgi:hypothetical protein